MPMQTQRIQIQGLKVIYLFIFFEGQGMGNFNPSLNFLWSILLPAKGVINHRVGQHDESGKDYTSFPLSADSALQEYLEKLHW